MRALFRSSRVVLAVVIATVALSVRVAEAIDGQVIINQNRAMAGISPCDAAGFPVTICDPGSYKLSGNLTVPDQNTTAIEVTADNVTIDLNGFGIFGPGIAGPNTVFGGSGVAAGFGRRNVTVMNGSVRGMGGDGVILAGSDHRVEKVFAMFNRTGINTSDGSVITGSTASSNRNYGILAAGGSTVVGNTASSNGLPGLGFTGTSSGYANNVLNNNNGGGEQVGGQGIQMGGNVCGAALCP